MPVAGNTYLRARRVKGEPAIGQGPEIQYPLNRVVHKILLDLYKDQYVIPCAVIELLRDYNPFSTRTGLTKKQVTKYLRILLDETPELADNIVASLPDGKDLLPPELLARIPPPGNPDTPPPPLSTTPSTTSRFTFPMVPRKKPIPRLPTKRQRTVGPEEFVPKFRKQQNAPLAIPLKPTLVQKPDKPVDNRELLSFHLNPPPLTPCNKTPTSFLLPSVSPNPKVAPLTKAASVDCVSVTSTWSGLGPTSIPTPHDLMSSSVSQPFSIFSFSGWEGGDAPRVISVPPRDGVNGSGDAADGDVCEKEKITQFNFNSVLPALASVMGSPCVPKPVKALKEYDPLLAAGSAKVPRARSLDSMMAPRQFVTPSQSRTSAPSSSQMLPDDVLLSYLNNSLKATDEELKVPKTSHPMLVIPSISSQTKLTQNSPSYTSQSAAFSLPSPAYNMHTDLSTLLMPNFPSINTLTSPPHLHTTSSITPFVSPSTVHNALNDLFLRRVNEQNSSTTLATAEDELASLFIANALPKSVND